MRLSTRILAELIQHDGLSDRELAEAIYKTGHRSTQINILDLAVGKPVTVRVDGLNDLEVRRFPFSESSRFSRYNTYSS
jgi:hypothetical protein